MSEIDVTPDPVAADRLLDLAEKCGYRDEKGMYGRALVCGREKGHAGVHIDFVRVNPGASYGSPGTKSVAFTEDGSPPRVREDATYEHRLTDLHTVPVSAAVSPAEPPERHDSEEEQWTT